ncbi:MAG: hypothetical protein R6V55_12165, partial [Desulfovermiculus sp.]
RIDRDDFWMPYQTRRGCPLDCSYCSTGRIEGRAGRQRSISRDWLPERVRDWSAKRSGLVIS